MPPTLTAYLIKRAHRQYRSLAELITNIPAEHALKYATESWPDHPWGVGQNGSISGIVYHVTAWKLLTLPIFSAGGQPLNRKAFDADAAPAVSDWLAVRQWFTEVGNEWDSQLDALTDEDMDGEHEWEGHTLTMHEFITDLMEHDVQHASQIEYLLQRIAWDAR